MDVGGKTASSFKASPVKCVASVPTFPRIDGTFGLLHRVVSRGPLRMLPG